MAPRTRILSLFGVMAAIFACRLAPAFGADCNGILDECDVFGSFKALGSIPGAGSGCARTVLVDSSAIPAGSDSAPGPRTSVRDADGDVVALAEHETGIPNPRSEAGLHTMTDFYSISPAPSFVGEPVTIHYTVWGTVTGGAPTGTVTVTDGTASCTGTLTPGTPIFGLPPAGGSCTITFTSAGTRTLTAVYEGEGEHDPSTSLPVSHSVLEVGTRGDTTTTIMTVGADLSVVGEAVSLFFEVTSSVGTPTGEVTISDGTDSCTGTIADPGAGTDKCSITFTSPGTRTLTAVYAGDSRFNGSTSAPYSHTVEKANTDIVVARLESDEPPKAGEVLTYVATVTVEPLGSGTPTGTVTFRAQRIVLAGDEILLGSISLDASGQAILSTTETPAGFGSVSVEYGGDGRFNPSTNVMFQTVEGPPSGGGGRSRGGGAMCGVGTIMLMPLTMVGMAWLRHRGAEVPQKREQA